MSSALIRIAAFLSLLLVQAPPAHAQSTACPDSKDEQEADCLYAQGVAAQDRTASTRLFMQALSIREQLHPDPNTIEEARQYLALADIFHAMGRNGKAEPMYRHSLSVLRDRVGPDSLESVKVIDHLALVLMESGRFVEAEPGLLKSVTILEKQQGPNHPDLIAPLDKLAWICDSTHRGQEAAAFRKRIDAIKSKNP